jgi:hypothetical protein
VHAAGVELHDAFRVRQSAVTDARIPRIELAEIDTCDQGIEHIGAPGHQVERLLHTGLRFAVLVDVAVVRGNDDGLGTVGLDRRRLAEPLSGGAKCDTCGGGGANELPA